MKKLTMLIVLALLATGLAMAQVSQGGPSGPYSGPAPAAGTLPYGTSNTGFNAALGQDVLGAHNGYGRGCVMCHAPHGGALGNNSPSGSGSPAPTTGYTNSPKSDTAGNGAIALWGENLAPYYGQTVTFPNVDQGTTTITLPASTSVEIGTGEQTVLLCLSCHDGSLTRPAMMAGQTVEALPIVGGTAPTLFGITTGNSALNYINEHPVGVSVSCGAPYNWDCTSSSNSAQIQITSSMNMYTFATSNYKGSFWYNYAKSGGASGYPLATFYTSSSSAYTVNGVTCTTCHNQHSMTVYSNKSGTYPTMFFIKGEYMPSTGGNSVAQFCRNCHGGESNEMNTLTGVPTT